MSNAEEIDKRIEGTEMAAMIDRGAANQRSGVLGSLNMVADAFKLLPKESETERRWSTVEWAKERKGWVFITSKPTMRERMRPLVSLWLDLLVLRRQAHVADGEPVENQSLSLASASTLPSQYERSRRGAILRPSPRRCSVKPPLRTKSVGTKVSEEEFAALETRARARKLTLSEWVRAELLEPRSDGGAAGTEVLLGEVLALRTILINLLFSLSNGKAVTPEAMKELIEKADGDKTRRAMERLTAAVAKVGPATEGAETEAGEAG